MSNVRDWLGEDYTTWDADKLRYQLDWITRHAVKELDDLAQLHAERHAAIRQQVDAGAILLPILHTAQRAGRKTVRIADVLAEAELRLAAIKEAP